MEKLKTRKEQNVKDCWDLTQIIKDEKEFNNLVKIVTDCNQKIVNLKGHIVDSLKDYLALSEKESRAYEKLILYTKLKFDEDTSNNQNHAKLLEIENLGNEINENEAFVISELMEKDLDDILAILKKDSELAKYELFFERLFKDKKRVLSEKEEMLVTLANTAFGTPDDAFTSLDVTDALFNPVKVGSKKVPLGHHNYNQFLENPNQEVRKLAFNNYHEYYEKHKNTFGSLLKGNYQELEFYRIVRKYDSALQMALDAIDVTPDVYDNLIEAVTKNLNLNIDFQKLKAKILNNAEYHLYDTYVPVVKIKKKKYTKDQAISLVNKALKVLGKDYLEHFNQIFANHTVDFYPNIGKETGAYQWGCFDSESYVLLNFNGTFDSVSTLAHELGHAVHSMYSKENNDYLYHSYELFVAEIASTVNETLLSFYMLDHAQEKKEKIYYLCEFLDKVKATIFRQTMFSEFEKIMSEKMQQKECLTEELMSQTYYKLNQKYFGDSVIIDDKIRYEWMRISHFYRPFYVYQYATGLISALCIVSNLLSDKNYQEKYLNFLKGGSSKNVLDLLKDIDIDLTTKKPFTIAFDLIKEKFDELQKLIKEGEYNE